MSFTASAIGEPEEMPLKELVLSSPGKFGFVLLLPDKLNIFTAFFIRNRLSSSGNLDRFQPPRRMDSSLNIGIPPRYRPFRLLEDEDSSDTDTGKIRLSWDEHFSFNH